jgi:hypothetical protein
LIAKETALETGLGIAGEQQFLPTACQVCIHCPFKSSSEKSTIDLHLLKEHEKVS